MLSLQALYVAYKQVKKNRGAAGIYGQIVDDFTQNLEAELKKLLLELKEKRYQAQPVKRVEIDKDDGGKRLLGIPTVRDRIGRSCHQAISKATLFIRRYNKRHVVDMNLSKCFDMLDHDLIIKFVQKRITDGSILNLIQQFLQSGVMIGSTFEQSEFGSPQGGVISPLLSNIYLNEFDQEMMSRECRIVRYADDILIFFTSKSGAENALKVASHILEVTLKLKVNERKTQIAHSDTGIKF
jgi:RNA-directed DNA polymerase